MTLDDFEFEYPRETPPRVKRKYPVHNPRNQQEKWGYVGVDNARIEERPEPPGERGRVWVYSSPRKRSENFFRKVGGYPISVDLLNRLENPGRAVRWSDPVEIVYIVQREGSEDHPPRTVFEFDLETYLDGTLISYEPFGDQLVPGLEDADAVWPGLGGDMFITGSL